MSEKYTIAEVAKKLGTTQKAVRRLVASKEIESVKTGAAYSISSEALTTFINTERIKQTNVPTNVYKGTPKDLLNWADISGWWDNVPLSQMTFVDLFCGCGGLSKGLEMSGMEGVCGLDFFKEACMTYEKNFNHPVINGDIKILENKHLFYETVSRQLNGRHLNVVAGGFPCQGFSMAGNRIVDDPRNSLYKELLEIVTTLQPDFVICENVKGLRSMLHGAVEAKIIQDFKDAGYEMQVAVLCAADYYTPQKRERVIFIGNRLGNPNFHPKPILSPDEYITTGESIADLMNHPEDPDFNHVPTRHRPDMRRRMLELEEGKSLYQGYSDAWKKCPWNEASCTIKENHGGVNIHPRLPRVLTAREMARLQSFPDDFIFMGPKNKQLVQIGNAVPPLLGKAIGLAVRYSFGELRH
ncbi:MAG: DNA cytosine methyltransferase [Muribaculaceae bacterium]|nr:DNA cytosine methyltransferase [Muribaculaceae bacterium]